MSGKPARKKVVFVSSTYLDNAERRSWVFEAIRRAGMTPLAMEDWTANPMPAREFSLARLAEADVYLGVLAWRYGWVPEGQSKSITELEYDEAVRLGLPRYLFWIDEPLSQVNVATEFDEDDPWNKQARLDEFKKRVKREQTARPFADEKLEVLVLQALTEWERGVGTGTTSETCASTPNPIEARRVELAGYLERVESECSTVSLAGFGGSLHVEPLLEDLFVELDLALARHEDEEEVLEQAWKFEGGERDPSSFTLLGALKEVAADPRRRGLVLLGHPGAGKTTILRRLASAVARQGATNLGIGDGELVPVLLPLRRLETTDGSLKAFAKRLVGDEDAGSDGAFAEWLWDEQRLLVLVDGLDEVPKERRSKVRDWVQSAAKHRRRHLVVVSSRHEGYLRSTRLDGGFLPLRLRPLSDERAQEFVRNWYSAVETGLLPRTATPRDVARTERGARALADSLIERLEAARSNARIYELAHNPMMLTAICLVHRDRKKLPERAADLYESAVRVLLELWREQKGLPPTLDPRKVQGVLQAVALWMHCEEGRTQATEEELELVLRAAMRESGWNTVTPTSFLATVRDESGLFTGWSADRYGFLHLAFQEYLAALETYRRVYALAGDEKRFLRGVGELATRIESSWWNEVLQLLFALDDKGLAGHLLRTWLRRPDLEQHTAVLESCLASLQNFDAAPFRELLRLPWEEGLWSNREWAATVLAGSGRAAVEPGDLDPALQLLDVPASSSAPIEDQLVAIRLAERFAPEALRERARTLATHDRPELRQASARATRIVVDALALESTGKLAGSIHGGAHVSGNLRGYWTEERSGIRLVQIPAGSFVMGSPASEEGRDADEGPQHEVKVAAFMLAIHPVTNEQYARFLAEEPDTQPPALWGDRDYNQPLQPVVGVSWHDAQAFCKWAGLVLPTEAQWEYACRAGTTTRFWSGDDEADLEQVGWYRENAGGRLHPVSEKPESRWGLFDMHGNVWEWCEDEWSSDYSKSQRAHPVAYTSGGSGKRVLRGGSFSLGAADARSAYRLHAFPSGRLPFLGFRPAKGITPG